MLIAVLLAAGSLVGWTGTPDTCSSASLPSRIAATSPREGAAALVRASLNGDADTLDCAAALAADQEAREEWLDRRYFTAARALIAQRQGDPHVAIALLEPLVAIQHHTVAIPSDFHALLSEAYRSVGRVNDAEGQRLLALAALESDPPFALTDADIRAMPAQSAPLDLLPTTPANPEPNLLELGSIRRDGAKRTYSTLLVFLQDEEGEAVRRVDRVVDCNSLRGEVVNITRLRADGAVIGNAPIDDPREDFNAALDHRRRLVCAAPVGHGRPTPIDAAVRLFRNTDVAR